MSNWNETAELYKGFIDYPELTEKHLKRPPFKYIFSIFISVLEKTGFCKSLFSDEEKKSGFYDDSKKKVKFLKTVITQVDKAIGQPQTIDIKNIMKGIECEQTNIFLQNIYHAANKKDISNKKIENTPNKTIVEKIEKNVNLEEKKVKKVLKKEENIQEVKDKSYPNEIIDEAKDLIQKITQNSNPLGKIVEFIEDDIESMNRENDKWTKVYKESKNKIIQLEKDAEEELQNYFDKLTEVDEQIDNKQAKINSLKSQIFRNNQKINNLVSKIIDN